MSKLIEPPVVLSTAMLNPLPCPFCGHVGVHVHEASTFRWLVAECDNCGAQCGEVRRDTLKLSTEDESKATAIAEWNTRFNAVVNGG